MQPENDSDKSPHNSEEASVAAAFETPPDSEAPTPKTRNRNWIRRAVIGVAIGAGLIALIQWIALSTDHQYANMASILVGVVTVIYVVFQLHFKASESGRRLLVPCVSVVSVAALIAMFRFDGFSGEMMPQYKLRFAEESHELRSLSGSAPAPAPASTSEAGEELDSTAVAMTDSLRFLGDSATAVIPVRQFSVPSDASQIKTLWNQGIGEGWSSFAVASDRAVTLEQRDELECVTCYRLIDGELLWMRSHEAYHQNTLGGVGPRSTPTIVGDRVYAQGATGRVWCLDLASGKEHWTVDLLEIAGWDQLESETLIAWGRAGSPLIIPQDPTDLCVVPFGGPEMNEETGRSLIALDADSGEVRWTAGEDQISFATPALLTLAGKQQIVSVNEKSITGNEIEDGNVLWDFEWLGQSNGPANCAMPIPAGENRFLIGKGYGGGSALVEIQKQASGNLVAEPIWSSTRLLKTKFTHACVDGDIAYAISNGSLEAVRISSMERLWTQPRKSRLGQGQILLVEDTIVGQAESGEVVFVAADPNEYRELLRIPAMDAITWNVPTIAGRHLLVRNDRQAICFVLPPRRD